MNVSDIQRLFDYTNWANDLAISAAAKLSDEHLQHDFGISHRSILGTLVHTAGADWIWRERWNGRSPGKDETLSLWSIESCSDVATLRQRWHDLNDARAQFISGLDDERLNLDLAFNLLNGQPNSMRLVDQMHHVANHATYHRGQVTGMIRQLGLEPPSTDLIFYLRSEITPK